MIRPTKIRGKFSRPEAMKKERADRLAAACRRWYSETSSRLSGNQCGAAEADRTPPRRPLLAGAPLRLLPRPPTQPALDHGRTPVGDAPTNSLNLLRMESATLFLDQIVAANGMSLFPAGNHYASFVATERRLAVGGAIVKAGRIRTQDSFRLVRTGSSSIWAFGRLESLIVVSGLHRAFEPR